jgi:phage FluMu gp28-like protein
MAFDIGPISEEEWISFRKESVQTLPPALVGQSMPDILLSYQKQLLRSTATHSVVATDKSRRIGATWAVGADAVLTSGADRKAGGMDTLYIGYNLDMAREFIDTCAMWAKSFMPACTEVAEFLFADKDESGADRAIQAFRIRFASGFEITALSSRPRSLRGRQGYVILDEFAFHDDAPGLLKAAMALLIWGGKVLVISTHNGEDNPFNQLLKDIRAGKLGEGATVMRATFDDAIEQGLYQRVCLKTGKPWSPEAEGQWRSGIRKFYGANAAEELDCIPSQGSGVYLSRAQIEACATSAGPVLKLICPAGFELKPEYERRSYVDAWLEQHVQPELNKLDRNLRHCFGQDFARSGDASVYVPLAIERDLRRRAPFVIEMRNVPFEQQKQVVYYVTERLPRFFAGNIDSTGNGQYLGEVAMQKFGISRIGQIKLHQGWYLENMPPMKAAFEDRTIEICAHADHVDDLRQIVMVRGVPMVPDSASNKGADGLMRHGDFAPALCLGYSASRGSAVEYDYRPVAPQNRVSGLDQVVDDDGWMTPDDTGPAGANIAAQLRRKGAY